MTKLVVLRDERKALMSEVTKVALAILNSDRRRAAGMSGLPIIKVVTLSDLPQGISHQYKQQARAAIRAMREMDI